MGLDRAIDITADQRKTVLALLASHLPNTTAWVYGSRVKWTAQVRSPIWIWWCLQLPTQAGQVSDLREAFEESNLPFRVDLFVWDEVPEQFRKTIEVEHVVFAEREEMGVPDDWRSQFRSAKLFWSTRQYVLIAAKPIPSVDMAAGKSQTLEVHFPLNRTQVSGRHNLGASTLAIRLWHGITPCLGNGKIARYYAPEFMAGRARLYRVR